MSTRWITHERSDGVFTCPRCGRDGELSAANPVPTLADTLELEVVCKAPSTARKAGCGFHWVEEFTWAATLTPSWPQARPIVHSVDASQQKGESHT